jgi:hypothetical protein
MSRSALCVMKREVIVKKRKYFRKRARCGKKEIVLMNMRQALYIKRVNLRRRNTPQMAH